MKKVVHLMRKFLPPTASFIYNQISFHQHYQPYIGYCENTPSVFRRQLEDNYPRFRIVGDGPGRFMYQYTRNLSPGDRQRLGRFIHEVAPDIIHVHYGVDALVFTDLFQTWKIPVIVSFYGYDCTSFPRRFKGLGKRWLQKKLFNNPHVQAYTAMSPDMRDDLVKIGCPQEKIIVHYHGSDTQPFFRKRTYPEKDEIQLLIVSSLAEKKGHLFLLKAFQRARQRSDRKLHLNIVGDGGLKKSLQEYVRQHGIQQVRFLGATDYGSAQHHQLLKQADIFVHPSVHTADGDKEGIPGALIESRSSGLPVISTYHAGIPYIVEQGKTGLLAEEHDVEALANHIITLADDAELRKKLGLAGQAYTREHLDVAQKEQDLERIYHQLVQHTQLDDSRQVG